jgi:hypothetical protein
MFIHVVDKTISMIKQYVYSCGGQDNINDKTICLFMWWIRQYQ